MHAVRPASAARSTEPRAPPSVLDIIRMPGAILLMDRVVLLDDLSVVGETVITELMFTLDTCEKKHQKSQQRPKINWQIIGYEGNGLSPHFLPPRMVFTSLPLPSTVVVMTGSPLCVASPAELVSTLDTYTTGF